MFYVPACHARATPAAMRACAPCCALLARHTAHAMLLRIRFLIDSAVFADRAIMFPATVFSR